MSMGYLHSPHSQTNSFLYFYYNAFVFLTLSFNQFLFSICFRIRLQKIFCISCGYQSLVTSQSLGTMIKNLISELKVGSVILVSILFHILFSCFSGCQDLSSARPSVSWGLILMGRLRVLLTVGWWTMPARRSTVPTSPSIWWLLFFSVSF